MEEQIVQKQIKSHHFRCQLHTIHYQIIDLSFHIDIILTYGESEFNKKIQKITKRENERELSRFCKL